MLYIKKGLSSLPSIQPIIQLHKNCHKYNGYPNKTYWHLINNRCSNNNNKHDFLAYINQELVGTLQLYYFDSIVELSFLIYHPYRQQEITYKMLYKAIRNLSRQNVSNCLIFCNDHDSNLISQMIEWGGHLKYCISEWQSPVQLTNKYASHHLTIVKADMSTLPDLVEISKQCCFTNSYDDLYEDLQNKNIHIYIAKDHQAKIIGKLHTCLEYNRVIMHDFGILTKYRNQGYGRSFIIQWLMQYLKTTTSPISVEIKDTNNKSLSLYQSCNFTQINNFCYYEFLVNDLLNVM